MIIVKIGSTLNLISYIYLWHRVIIAVALLIICHSSAYIAIYFIAETAIFQKPTIVLLFLGAIFSRTITITEIVVKNPIFGEMMFARVIATLNLKKITNKIRTF
jgi:hypothetical protein